MALRDQGYGLWEISRELNISRNTVRTWIRRHEDEGVLEDRRRYNHGVRRISLEQRQDMQRYVEEHPFTPTRYFAARYDHFRGTDICSRLVGSMRSRLLEVIENNGAYTRF